jgi:hypothetical protein
VKVWLADLLQRAADWLDPEGTALREDEVILTRAELAEFESLVDELEGEFGELETAVRGRPQASPHRRFGWRPV